MSKKELVNFVGILSQVGLYCVALQEAGQVKRWFAQ
jgi:hypothetical protein